MLSSPTVNLSHCHRREKVKSLGGSPHLYPGAPEGIPTPRISLSRPITIHSPHPNCPDTLDCLPDTDGRPQHTLPVILRCAILGSQRKRLTIRDIYAAMEGKYPYYRTAGATWKVSASLPRASFMPTSPPKWAASNLSGITFR